MKGIQLVGTTFPRVRYAFMSKIKPNTEKYIIENTDNSSFLNQKFHQLITQRDLKILQSKMNDDNKKEIEEMVEKNAVPLEKSPTLGCLFKENLNFVVVCNDFKKWVKHNAKMNPKHSFFYRNNYTLRLLNFLCYRNNFIHTCRFENEQFNVSYHVIDVGKFKDSLSDWKNYQVASLLQRPYFELVSDESLDQFKKKNMVNAIAFNCLALMENEESQFLVIDEQNFFNHLANLPELVNEFQPELDAAMHDYVDKKNVSEYHKLYKEALNDSPLKDICQYNQKKKEFIINNSVKAREVFFKNLANGLKQHFWVLGKKKLMGKKYTNPLVEEPAFMNDYIYLLSRDSAQIYKYLLSHCLANVSNVRTETLKNLKKRLAWNVFLFFGTFFFVFGFLDSIREYLRVEKRLFEYLNKENLDLVEFNLVDREPVASNNSEESAENNTNASSAVQNAEVKI